MFSFVNAAHFLVHYMVLVFPTAVIAMSPELGIAYGELIPLATGTLVAFGLLSLPVGLLVNPVGPARLLAAFFLLIGAASIAVAFASTYLALALTLLALGAAAAFYHPVGLTLLAATSRRLGHDLAVNGVWGNLGSALAAALTALLADNLGWRFAFVVPGVVAMSLGIAFIVVMRPGPGAAKSVSEEAVQVLPVARPFYALVSVAAAIIAGGITYNIVTVALPKIVDEQFASGLSLSSTGAIATAIFVCGALMQLAAGGLGDRDSRPTRVILRAARQLTGLTMAWAFAGPLVLCGLALTMAAIYGQVVVDDAIVARFVSERFRGRAYGASYTLGFAVSALAIPLMGYLHAQGAGFAPVLALTAACGLMLLACAVGFSVAVARR